MSTPFFPGYTFKDGPGKQMKPKGQQLRVEKGLMVTKTPDPKVLDKQIEQTRNLLMCYEEELENTPENNFKYESDVPSAQDSPVLLFYAYFKQSLTEAMQETFRVRYVKIFVYVEDDTLMIEEKRFRNSGMEQGVILRRMRIENPRAKKSGTYYSSNDFNVGIDIDLCGIVYHIYDCNIFTRSFLTENQIDVPQAETPPDDLYTVKRQLTERPIRVSRTNNDKKNLKNFIDYDGKVLRFYAVWDDRGKIFGEKRKFIIIYFLVDGKIEIRQVVVPNSGRDNYSQFLSKTYLKKPNSSETYSSEDLYIGQVINAHGRPFLIYDADEFTKKWVDENYGPHNWKPIEQDEDGHYSVTQAQIPPYNGWGDELDSLGYVFSLHPNPPKKNLIKMMKNDGRVLRFLSIFKNPSPTDEGRQFVIAYYLADDTLAVFEQPRRNSGFKEGKFIQKSKIRNSQTGKSIEPTDLYVGAEVHINGYIFVIIDADELAYCLMEADADSFPYSDLFRIIDSINKKGLPIDTMRREFEGLDPELAGYIPKEDAIKKISNQLRLIPQETMTIIRRWTSVHGFDYFAFLSSIN